MPIAWTVALLAGIAGRAEAQTLLVDSPLCDDEQGHCTFSMPIPDGIDFWSLGVVAANEARINDRALVYADDSFPLPVVSAIKDGSGYVRIGVEATVGHVIGDGEVAVEDRASVYGNVYAGTPTIRSAAFVAGKVASFSELTYRSRALLDVTWPTVTQERVIRDPGQASSTTLRPNAECPELKIGSNTSYTIDQPGDYFIERLVVDSGGTLRIDVPTGIVRLFVEGEIVLNGEVEEVLYNIVEPSAPAAPAETPTRFLLASLSDQGVSLNNNFDGVVIAPRGKITARGWLDDGGWRQYRGAFFAKEVELHQGGKLAVVNNPDLWGVEFELPEVEPDDTARFVPGIGYLDGTNCAHWPQDKVPGDYLPALIGGTDDPAKTDDVAWLLDELERIGLETLTEIGAPRSLMLGYYDAPAADGVGWERRVVAADVDAKKGYDISYAGLCTQDDLLSHACTTKPLEVTLGDDTEAIEVLTRATRRQRSDTFDEEETLAVLLTAPVVAVAAVPDSTPVDRLELDVSLVVAAGFLSGTTNSRLAVKPHMEPLGLGDWQADLAEPSRPGVLAVFAQEVLGFESVAAYSGARIGRLSFVDDSHEATYWDYAVQYGTDVTSYRELQLPKSAAFATIHVDIGSTVGDEETNRMPQWWCDGWYGAASGGYPFFEDLCWAGGSQNYCAHYFCNGTLILPPGQLMHIPQTFWWPEINTAINPAILVRRDFDQGGAVLVSAGSMPAGLEMWAPPGAPLALDGDAMSQPRERIPAWNLGRDLLTDIYGDSKFWPDTPAVYPGKEVWRCGDPVYTLDRGGFLTSLQLPNCNALSGAQVDVEGYPSARLAETDLIPAGRELTAYLNSVIVQAWDEVATDGPEPAVRQTDSNLAALNGAQLVTEGAYFDLLEDEAELDALEHGRPGLAYVRLALMADAAAPNGEDTYVPAALNDRAHMMALQLGNPDVTVPINALGVPYGYVAAPWFPILADPDTPTEVYVTDILNRWEKVHEMVVKLHEAADDLLVNENMNSLADAADLLSNDLMTYSERLEGAAKRDLIGQDQAKSTLTEVLANIDGARESFENALRVVFELPPCDLDGSTPCDFGALDAPMLSMASSVAAECEAKNKADVFPDIIDTVARMAPVAAGIAGGIDSISGALNAAADGGGIIRSLGGNLSNYQYAELAEDFDAITSTVSTAGRILGSVDDVRGAMEKVVGALQSVQGECQDAADESAAIGMLSDVAQNHALLDTWALQAETIYAVLSSVQSTFEYQLGNMASNVELQSDVVDVRSRLLLLTEQLDSGEQKRAEFVVASCEAVQQTARVQQAELYGLSQLLQTSAGRAWVEPDLVVPAQDLRRVSGGLESTSDLNFEFSSNIWDRSSFEPSIQPDGTIVEPFADVAASRFSNLILTNTCRNLRHAPGAVEPWPVSVSVVRKVLPAHELSEFKSGGTTEVTLTLPELMRAEGLYGYTPVMLYDVFEGSYSVPMSAPVIVAVRYSACSGGTATDPCCENTGSCTRGSLDAGESPVILLQGGALVPNASGCEADERTSAVIAVGDQLSSVSTCMVPVAAPNMKSTMLSLVPDINTEQFIWEGTDDMCEHSTGDLLLKGVRGLPLFGSWLLTHSSQSAQALSEFDEPTPPGADWISDNAGISGFELQFFIMAEPSASQGEPTPFMLEPIGI